MNPDELATWTEIQKGNVQVFETYYKAHYKVFFLAAAKYLPNGLLAQEIVNDVFLKIWMNSSSIQIESSLNAYIYRAIVNRSLSALDKNSRDLQHQIAISRQTETSYQSNGLETEELRTRLYQAIDKLPDQCRRVFIMSRFEKLKQREIADRLGISIKTVKNHITHALKNLYKVLREWNSFPAWIMLIKELVGYHN